MSNVDGVTEPVVSVQDEKSVNVPQANLPTPSQGPAGDGDVSMGRAGDENVNKEGGEQRTAGDNGTGEVQEKESTDKPERSEKRRSRSRSPRRSSRDRDRKSRDDKRDSRDKRRGDDDRDRRRSKRSKSRSRDRSKREEKDKPSKDGNGKGEKDDTASVDNKPDEKDKKSSRKSRSRSPERRRDRSTSRDRRRRRDPSRDRRRGSSRDRRRRSSSRDRDDRRRRRRSSRSRSDSRDRRRRSRRESSSRSRSRDRRRRDRRSKSASRSPSRVRKELPIPGPPPGMEATGGLKVADIIQDVLRKKTAPGLPPPVGIPPAGTGGIPTLMPTPVNNAALVAMNNLAATKPARELYIGGIPPGISALQLQTICSQLLIQLGGTTAPGNPIISGWIASDGVYGFVEFRSIEECNNGLVLLNGQPCLGGIMRVGRPKSYTGSQFNAMAGIGVPGLGPSLVTPTPGMGVPGMLPGSTLPMLPGVQPTVLTPSTLPMSVPTTEAGPERIVVSNIPPHLRNRATLMEILSPFGDIKDCTLLVDPDTGAVRDVAVLEYATHAAADTAYKAIPSIPIGAAPLVAEWPKDCVTMDTPPTTVVELTNVSTEEEVHSAEEASELEEDVKDECQQFGKAVKVVVPLPGTPKFGLVFVQFESERAAVLAVKGLRGRKFANRVVAARFVKEADIPSA